MPPWSRTGSPTTRRSEGDKMGSARRGSLQLSGILTETFWVLPLTYFWYLPKSARVYLFPQSVEIRYFCSSPIKCRPHLSTTNRHSLDMYTYIYIYIYIYIYMYIYIYIYIHIYIYIYISLSLSLSLYIYIYIYIYICAHWSAAQAIASAGRAAQWARSWNFIAQ